MILWCLGNRAKSYTIAGFVVFVGLHGLVGSCAADELVGPFRLMWTVFELVVVLGFLGVVCER